MVKLSDDAHVPLNVVGSVLSSSGRLDRLPVEEQRATMLWKKEDGRGMETTLGVFQAGPDSLDLEEYIYVLGLPLDLPVPWHLLSASTRQAPLDLSGSEGRMRVLRTVLNTVSMIGAENRKRRISIEE